MAGEAGQLVGTITDEHGRAIAGAKVTLSGGGASCGRWVLTDGWGAYRIFALDAVRPVNVLVEADGKVAVEYLGYRVRPDRVTRLDVKLRARGTHDVLVLLDARVPYHRLALDGARSTLPRRVRLMEVREATPAWSQQLLRALEDRPSAVLAIGELAARAARSHVQDAPVVHTMVPDPYPEEMASGTMCGLSLVGGFERQIERLVSLDPGVRRIGTIYDPARLSRAVTRLRRVVEEAGLTLLAAHAHDPEDLPRALDDLARQDLDAFVVLMDPEVYSARNFALVRRFAEEKDLVLVVPDPSMAGAGKSFTLTPDFWESGAVAGRLVRQIVEGRLSPADVGVREPTEGEVAAATAASPSLKWRPAPDGEPPLVGAVGLSAELRDPLPGGGDPEER
jgi:putative ABC transport system substrate-binding protein